MYDVHLIERLGIKIIQNNHIFIAHITQKLTECFLSET